MNQQEIALAVKELAEAMTKISDCLDSLSRSLDQRSVARPPREPRRVIIRPKEVVFSRGNTIYARVYKTIVNNRDGISVANLRKELGISAQNLQNTLYRLKKDGKIKAKSRGVYSAIV